MHERTPPSPRMTILLRQTYLPTYLPSVHTLEEQMQSR